jgi:hypothetical protein
MMLANHRLECFADGDVPFADPQATLNPTRELHRSGKRPDTTGFDCGYVAGFRDMWVEWFTR